MCIYNDETIAGDSLEILKGMRRKMIETAQSERNKLEEKYKNLIVSTRVLTRRLVSFQADKNVPVFNWFGFKEGFSSDMVKLFIKECPKKVGIVFDPFAGACTTLLCAKEKKFYNISRKFR